MSKSMFSTTLSAATAMVLALALPVGAGASVAGTASAAGAGNTVGVTGMASAAGATSPAAGATGSAPVLSATVEQCLTASTQAGRAVTFTGQMETVAGAHRMAMQIVVEEHTPGEAGFHLLTPGGVGVWQRSEVGVKIYKYVRQVTDLPAPASFRAIVFYRWLGERGHVLKHDERRTAVCREPSEPPMSGTTPPATML
jgi:hypothetical protein